MELTLNFHSQAFSTVSSNESPLETAGLESTFITPFVNSLARLVSLLGSLGAGGGGGGVELVGVLLAMFAVVLARSCVPLAFSGLSLVSMISKISFPTRLAFRLRPVYNWFLDSTFYIYLNNRRC